ncbi:hypothetical protein E2C01_061754 [Portunus trituberculatus]|uniref:Uncharacterized protein n=1 Tax=Portunus trituberculatus TaxID=210409 RepID=A0A5B7HFA0_PORTR|nr:hypothetical protein [Portunus trituberculatus]
MAGPGLFIYLRGPLWLLLQLKRLVGNPVPSGLCLLPSVGANEERRSASFFLLPLLTFFLTQLWWPGWRTMSTWLLSNVHSLFGVSFCALWEQDKRADKEGCIFLCLFVGSCPQALCYRGILLGPGVLAVEDPMAEVNLAREVVCSPVPVGACLQQH